MVLEKTLQSPLDSKEIQPVHPKGNQSWIFFGRTKAEAETLVLWPTDAKNWLIGKDPDAGKTEVWGEGDNRGWDVPFSFYPQSLPASESLHQTTGKTIALTRRTFVGKVMSLLFNMLSRLVITFLPRSKHLLISWLQSPSAVISEPPKNKVSHYFHCFPIYLPWSNRTGCHDLSFLNVEL